MEILSFGKTGWGDELFYATLMTIAVSITAMLIGFLFSLIFTPLKLSNNKFLNFIANSYTTVIRGVPELLVIYLFLLLLPADAAAASVTFGNAICEYWLAEESNVGRYSKYNLSGTGLKANRTISVRAH